MQDATHCIQIRTASTEGFDSLAVPVYRASTIVFEDAEAYTRRFERGPEGYTYGLHGTPTTRTLEARIAALEHGHHALLLPSGMAAIAVTLLSVLRQGDHLLLPDTVYPPVRSFADHTLAAFGIHSSYYDPLDTTGFATHLRATTRLAWVESPGSTTMEFQDLPAIARAARAAGVLVGCDNTWATPLLFKPLDHGADFSIEAVTKYMAGHSDLLMGSIAVKDQSLFASCRATAGAFGYGVSPDDCSLALRGLQTLDVRLRHAAASAWTLAQWLRRQPLVHQVLHPAFADHPGHAVWARDFSGASGVFSLTVRPDRAEQVPAALDGLRCFAIGASWGGTHSLIVPMDISTSRSATPATAGPVLRLSVGLEAVEDLQADLAGFLQRLEARA